MLQIERALWMLFIIFTIHACFEVTVIYCKDWFLSGVQFLKRKFGR